MTNERTKSAEAQGRLFHQDFLSVPDVNARRSLSGQHVTVHALAVQVVDSTVLLLTIGYKCDL